MSSSIVVDTDVFSILWQRKGDSDKYTGRLAGSIPVLSFASVAEARFGAAYAGWGASRMALLEEAMRRYVIAPYDDQMPLLWGQLKAEARRQGHPLGQATQTNDLWVATTAIYYQAPLLTANVRHFEDFPGLSLIRI